MATVGNPQVDFGAKVPKEEFERFKKKFPMYGAQTWFINMALTDFNQRVEEDPSIEDKVRQSVENMVQLNRSLT